MAGAMTRGSLEYTVFKKKRFTHLADPSNGKWATRRDVRNVGISPSLGLYKDEWLTVNGTSFGPDLQFGYVMGELFDAPVLLLKSCTGNRALGWDLLPPGSPEYVYDGEVYAGYGESPLKWEVGTEPVPIHWYAGKEYDDDINDAKQILDNIGEAYPNASSYKIEGFLWWQGDRDRREPAHALHYEEHLVRVIKRLRKDFNAPKAKFVIATIGFDGYNMDKETFEVFEAQMAVSGRKYPEFQNNVQTVDIRSSWRGGAAHYDRNAEVYLETGNALGLAMAKLVMPND